MASNQSNNKRFWEKTRIVEEEIEMYTYSCPRCNTKLFSIPINVKIPDEKEKVTCPNGHIVRVPKFENVKKY